MTFSNIKNIFMSHKIYHQKTWYLWRKEEGEGNIEEEKEETEQ